MLIAISTFPSCRLSLYTGTTHLALRFSVSRKEAERVRQFLKKNTCTSKTALKKPCMGSDTEKSRNYFFLPGPVFDSCTSFCLSKRLVQPNLGEEKYHAPENCPFPTHHCPLSVRKIVVHSRSAFRLFNGLFVYI